MHEPSAYLSIHDTPTRALISKTRLKQLVFSVVVVIFVSIGAVGISATYNAASSTAGSPSDNPVRTVLHLPSFTPPPTPDPTTPAPTPPSTAGTTNGTPQMTPTRSTPRPSPTTPSSSPGGNSSQSNPSGVVDLSGKDIDDGSESSSSSKASGSSSSAVSRGNASGDSGAGHSSTSTPAPPSRTPSTTVSPGATTITGTTPSPESRTQTPSTLDPAAPVPSAFASLPPLSPSASAPTSGSATPSGITRSPTPSGSVVNDQPAVDLSGPRPTPQGSATGIAGTTSNPRPTPRRTTTSSPPMPVGGPLASVPEPTTPPRPSYLSMVAIQDAAEPSADIVGDSNMVEYPDMGCSLPNYMSKNGKLFAVGPAGETHELAIKGVNWFGMETDARVPLGLGASELEGSTLFEIGAFLARNRFNSVRLPLSVASVLSNAAPDKMRVNQAENRALNLASYLTTLQSIIQGLAYHHISVLIALDAHQHMNDEGVSEEHQLLAIDALTSGLCNKAYWNVLGLDLRSDPVTSTWGDGSDTDFRAAATRMGNRMLDGCSKWLAFVEGTSDSHEWTSPSTGKQYRFEDWWGGGLANAGAFPVALALPDKVVYAPHYHSPSVYPASYFYQDDGVSELSDKELEANVRGTFDTMFGYLAKEPRGPALVLGEFGALYTTDRHPQKTTQRVFEDIVQLVSTTPGVAGGYVWSLNPERGFVFNYGREADGAGGFREGLVRSDWRAGNLPLLAALTPLDAMPGLAPLQCIKKSFRLRRR